MSPDAEKSLYRRKREMIFERKKFIEALLKMMPGVDKKGLVDQMTMFHFTGKEILTYNDQVFVRLPFLTDFECSVHAQTLYNLLNKLDTEKVKVELKDGRLKFNTAGVAASFTIGEGSEINEILNSVLNEIKSQTKFYNLPEDLMTALDLCRFSAFVKDIGGALTCIKIVDDKVLSTDRSRLSLYTMKVPIKSESFMVKASVVNDLLNYTPKLYCLTRAWIHFFESKDGLVYSVRRFEGDYPVEDALDLFSNAKPKYRISLPDGVLDSIGFVKLFTDEQDQKTINIKVADGQMSINASGTRGIISKKLKDVINTVDSATDFSFNINPIMLAEIIKLGCKELQIVNVKKGNDNLPLALFKVHNFRHIIALIV